MSPPPRRPGSSADWLRYARADLALARVRLPQDGLYELLCFHAQQAAGKEPQSYTAAQRLLSRREPICLHSWLTYFLRTSLER